MQFDKNEKTRCFRKVIYTADSQGEFSFSIIMKVIFGNEARIYFSIAQGDSNADLKYLEQYNKTVLRAIKKDIADQFIYFCRDSRLGEYDHNNIVVIYDESEKLHYVKHLIH